MRKSSQVKDLNRWERIVDAPEAARIPLPHPGVEEQRQRLAAIVARLRALRAEREVARATLQGIYQQIRELQAEGQELSGRIAIGLKGIYGANHTKLYAFGLRPDRRYADRISDPPDPEPLPVESDPHEP